MGYHTLPLSKPVTVAGHTVTELKFRDELCAGDLRGIKIATLGELPTDDLLKLGGRLSGQPDAVMNALSMEDFVGLVGVITGFLGPGPRTGTTGSP